MSYGEPRVYTCCFGQSPLFGVVANRRPTGAIGLSLSYVALGYL